MIHNLTSVIVTNYISTKVTGFVFTNSFAACLVVISSLDKYQLSSRFASSIVKHNYYAQ